MWLEELLFLVPPSLLLGIKSNDFDSLTFSLAPSYGRDFTFFVILTFSSSTKV